MRFIYLLMLSCILGCSATAGEPLADKRSPEAEQAAKDRRLAIEREIKSLGRDSWAGDYYAGDGLGVNTTLVIAPKSGYVFEWHGCLGLYDRNFGDVSSDGGQLRLSFTFENERKGFQGIAQDFIAIRWGKRCYLVPADDVIGFCNQVNSGYEPREDSYGLYLLRAGDEKEKVDGFPAVPKEYTDYLLAEPIKAEIVSVGKPTIRPSICDWNFKDIPVTLNAGSTAGLKVGMELHVIDSYHTAKVVKVEADRCEAVITQFEDDEELPIVGSSATTRWLNLEMSQSADR